MKKYRRGSKIVEFVQRRLKRPNKSDENTEQGPLASSETAQNSRSTIDNAAIEPQQSTSYQQDTNDQEKLLEPDPRDIYEFTYEADVESVSSSTSRQTTKSGRDDTQGDTFRSNLRPASLLTLLNDDLYLTDSSDELTNNSTTSSDFIDYLLKSANDAVKKKSIQRNSSDWFPERVASGNDTMQNKNIEAVTPSGSNTSVQKNSKRRQAVPSQWKKNLRKEKRLHGEPYVSAKGILVPGKTLKESPCIGHCIHLCTTKFNEEERLDIFSSFWSISNVEQKRLYIVNLIQREKTKTNNTESRKKLTNKYFLQKVGTTENIRVCQKFFIATLSVTETFIRFCFKKVINTDTVVEDKRGKHSPHNKKPKEVREHVRKHIRSFPRMPAPRVRGEVKKEYLSRNLNLTKMYKLYKIKCDSEMRESVELAYYRSVFKKDFNIGFHRPGRDVCDTCTAFEQMNRKEKRKEKRRHDEHLRRIATARQHRGEAKSLAQLGEIHFAEYDLKTICECPSTSSKLKRKIPVNNFTILDFNKQKRNVLCFCWDDRIARKGATEIGSCLYKYLQSVADGKPITFMSDTCASQCRNMYISSLLLYCIETLNIPEINQKYFEQGHSQLETDSIHDNIEKSKKNSVIVNQSDFYDIIRKSLRKYPNNVYEMGADDFIDLKYLKNTLIKNAKIDTHGEPVNWYNIRWLQYRKQNPNHIYFKYDMDETKFNIIKVIRRGERLQKCEEIVLLKKTYHAPLSTKGEKYSG